MFRYVAFVWNDLDPVARHDAEVLRERLRAGSRAWSQTLRCDGLEVFCADVLPGASEPHLLHDGAGVVLGKLFARGSEARSTSAPVALGERESAQILASAGRLLVDRYWGRYVAFLHDGPSGKTWVLRDPTAFLPCFTARLLSVDVYFSHMEDVENLGRYKFSVNWPYVAATLCQTRLQIHATGLQEVSQVLGGECVEVIQDRSTRRFYWNSLQIAAHDVIDDASEAARALREQTRDCVHAWASSYRSILHMLSGGLDSSIILACMKDAPSRPQLTCVNYYSPGSNTDERAYARLAASDAECELIERQRDSTLSLEALLHIRKSPVPTDYFFYLDRGRNEAQLASERQATAVFTGYGGDQLFYQARARFAAGDYLARHGIGPRLFSVALDAARVDRVSVWNVLREAASHSVLRRRWSLQSEPSRPGSLVRDEVARDISRNSELVHPWFRAPGSAPSGKLWHAYQLLFPADFYNPLGSTTDPELVTPLFSQPLLELVLRIPTWLLTLGGWDRAMARRAFQHDVPRPIVTRRTKGGQEEHAKAILVRNLAFARELLLEGRLVKEGILEPARVAEALSGRPTRVGSGNAELYGCLSAEAWLRQWQPV